MLLKANSILRDDITIENTVLMELPSFVITDSDVVTAFMDDLGRIKALAESKTDYFDKSCPSILMLLRFTKKVEKTLTNSTSSEKDKVLYRIVLNSLNNPGDSLYFSQEEISWIQSQTKVDPVKLRAFFNNQRSRHISRIKKAAQNDLTLILEKIQTLSMQIDMYLSELTDSPVTSPVITSHH